MPFKKLLYRSATDYTYNWFSSYSIENGSSKTYYLIFYQYNEFWYTMFYKDVLSSIILKTYSFHIYYLDLFKRMHVSQYWIKLNTSHLSQKEEKLNRWIDIEICKYWIYQYFYLCKSLSFYLKYALYTKM